MKKLKYIIILILLAPLALNAQCVFDTIPPGPPFPPYRDTTQAGTPLDCYVPACTSCSTSFSVTVFPIDGCLIIGGDTGTVTVIVRDSCNLILLDTCFIVSPVITHKVCYSYPDYTIMTICRDTIGAITVQFDPVGGTGHPLLDTIADYDTLSPCPPLMLEDYNIFWLMEGLELIYECTPLGQSPVPQGYNGIIFQVWRNLWGEERTRKLVILQ